MSSTGFQLGTGRRRAIRRSLYGPNAHGASAVVAAARPVRRRCRAVARRRTGIFPSSEDPGAFAVPGRPWSDWGTRESLEAHHEGARA